MLFDLFITLLYAECITLYFTKRVRMFFRKILKKIFEILSVFENIIRICKTFAHLHRPLSLNIQGFALIREVLFYIYFTLSFVLHLFSKLACASLQTVFIGAEVACRNNLARFSLGFNAFV